MSSEYRMEWLTTKEFEELVSPSTVALIPLGATEQHGPHLALGTDARIAERLAEATVAACEGSAIMSPAIKVGFSPHHVSFPGTITARTETLQAMLTDTFDSLARCGITRFIIVNAHGGNLAFLPAFTAEVRRDKGFQVGLVHWSLLGRDLVVEIAVSKVYGHACEVETSLALAADPRLVRERELPGPAPLPDSPFHLLRGQAIPEREVGVFLPRSFQDIATDGFLGEPCRADVQDGKRLFDVVVARTVEFVGFLGQSEADGVMP